MKWRPFDVKSFLKASKHWDGDIKKLNQKLEDISYLPSNNNETGIRGSDISEAPYRIALQRLKIQSEIEEIKLYKEMLRHGMKSLSDEETELINGFFYPKKEIGYFVHEYGRKYGIRERGVYEKRERVLEKMRNAIESKYYK